MNNITYRDMINDAKEIIAIKLKVEKELANPFIGKNDRLKELEEEKKMILSLKKQEGLGEFHRDRLDHINKAISILTDTLGVQGVATIIKSLDSLASTEIKLIEAGLMSTEVKVIEEAELSQEKKDSLLALIKRGFNN